MLRRLLLLEMLLFLLASSSPALALLVTDFGANGEGGDVNGQLFRLGTLGQVHELDAFVRLGAQDLNGTADGVAAQLSLDPLPAALGFEFSAALFGTGGVLLQYDFTNLSPGSLSGLVFLSFLDAEIVETTNTFFNEFGSVAGVASAGHGWEIDEPGFTTGDVFDHLLAGALDGTNALPAGSPDDVAMALSFGIRPLSAGEIARIEILISESGESLGGVALTHHDPANPTTITYSGRTTVVPEPATAALLAFGLCAIAARRRRVAGCA
jgi:hypothetical protein